MKFIDQLTSGNETIRSDGRSRGVNQKTDSTDICTPRSSPHFVSRVW